MLGALCVSLDWQDAKEEESACDKRRVTWGGPSSAFGLEASTPTRSIFQTTKLVGCKRSNSEKVKFFSDERRESPQPEQARFLCQPKKNEKEREKK